MRRVLLDRREVSQRLPSPLWVCPPKKTWQELETIECDGRADVIDLRGLTRRFDGATSSHAVPGDVVVSMLSLASLYRNRFNCLNLTRKL